VEIAFQSESKVQYLRVKVVYSQPAWRSNSGRGSAGHRPHCRKQAGHLRSRHRCARNRVHMGDGTMDTLSNPLEARRVVRATVKRCRKQQLHYRDVWMLVSRLVADDKHSVVRCLTKRFLCSRHWCKGSVTSAVVACGQPCLLRGDAHAVAVSRDDATAMGKLLWWRKQASALHVSLHLGIVMRQSHLPPLRGETFCHLRVRWLLAFCQALNVVLSWSHLPALDVDIKSSLTCT
jgi:hypothetical protein